MTEQLTNIHIKHKIRSLGYNISVALRKLLQGSGRERQATYKFVTKKAGSLNIKDCCEVKKKSNKVKEFSTVCMGRCKPLGSLNPSLSYVLQLSGIKSCFLVHLKGWQMAVSCLPPVSQSLPLGWQHLLDWRSGSSHSQFEAKNRWWMQYISSTEMAELSVLSIQFYCEPKVAVKHNVYIQKYPWKLQAQIFIDLHNF